MTSLSNCFYGEMPSTSEVGTMLDDALTNRTTEVAKLSSWHDNGFGKLVLEGREDGSAIRVHIWTNEGDQWSEETNIHSHRADFSSHLIRGEVRTRMYELTPGAKYRQYAYQSQQRGQDYSMKYVGMSDADMSIELFGGMGFLYRLQHHAVHSVSTRGPIVMTVVVTEATQSKTTTVLTNRLPAEDVKGGFRQIEVDECQKLLRLALDSLSLLNT